MALRFYKSENKTTKKCLTITESNFYELFLRKGCCDSEGSGRVLVGHDFVWQMIYFFVRRKIVLLYSVGGIHSDVLVDAATVYT